MNTKPVRQALAAGALMMASTTGLPAQDTPASTIAERIAEARLSSEELARLSEDAGSKRPLVLAAAGQGEKDLDETAAKSEEANATMAEFFRATAMTSLLVNPAAAPPSDDVPRPNIPVSPTTTRITSDDGAFFDSKNGLLIFLKNVVVKDPRFTLSGADELKVFFDPKQDPASAKNTSKPPAQDTGAPPPEPVKPAGPAAGAKPVKPDKSGISGAKFGKANRIIATGTVVVEYQSEDPSEAPIKASARSLVYDLKKEEFILRGGSPWVLREGQLSSVPGDDAYIVIKKDGSFVTGNGGIDAQMEIKEKKAGDKKNP